jgi:hypothetical protein
MPALGTTAGALSAAGVCDAVSGRAEPVRAPRRWRRRVAARGGLRLARGAEAPARFCVRGPARLCLGSGNAPIPGWVNIDLDGAPDVRLDLAHRLPVADGAIDLILTAST